MKIPQINQYYNFYDDGKRSESRRYKALVLRIINKEQSKEIFFPIYVNEYTDWQPSTITFKEEPIGKISLYDKWQIEIENAPWLYKKDTDLFIECEIKGYDENTIWFVRTKQNNWFSMDIQSCWQCGLLDVDGIYSENTK